MAAGAYDNKAAHGEADDILLNELRRAGIEDVADAYDRAQSGVGFWYA